MNIRKKKWIIIGIIAFFVLLIVIGASSGGNQQTAKQTQVLKVKPTMIPITANKKLSDDGKKWKSLDEVELNHEFKLSTKCALIIGDVANGNVASLGNWSTAYDPIYDMDGEISDALNTVDKDGKDASSSANVAIWNKLSDIDGQIDSDLGNVENACDYLSQDPTAENDVSSYESTVKSDQQDIANLMLQRNNIINTLKANGQL